MAGDLDVSNWQEWIVVSGYLGFMVFIAWRVITSKTPDQ